MHGPIELVPGVLYRLGSQVPIKNLSWVPESVEGFEPLSCYVFTAGDEAIFIDAGAAIIRDEVVSALDGWLAGLARSVFVTRCEGENIGNLALVLTGERTRLLFGGGGGVLEWIHRPRQDGSGEENLVGRVPITPANNGMSLDAASGLRFHWMDAPIKQMYLTQWAYEERTRTLFPSEFFSWQHTRDADGAPIVSDPGAVPSVEAVAAAIDCRTNWLKGAKFPDQIALLSHIFDTYPIERIAPVHGCVIEGSATIERTLEVAVEALHLLQASA